MLEAFTSYILPALYTLAAAALLGLMAVGGYWLAQKAKSSKIAAVAAKAWAMAQAIVAHVETQIRPQVAKALEDGKLTKEEAAELKARALELFKEAIGQHGIAELKSVLGLVGGSVEVWLGGMLERAVQVQKVDQAKVEASKAITVITTAAAGNTPPQELAKKVADAIAEAAGKTPAGQALGKVGQAIGAFGSVAGLPVPK